MSESDESSDDDLEVELEINKAIFNNDGDRLLRAVVVFLKRHNITADAAIVAQIPIKNHLQVAEN